MNAKHITGIIRLPFLTLSPLSVAVGAALAWWKTGHIDPGLLFLVLIGAIAAHISVNALNEYFDFKSGLDLKTIRTPFSGGSGALPENPALCSTALTIGTAALLLSAGLGLYFISLRGYGLLWTGLPGLVLVATYSPFILRNAFLTLIASGAGFGPAMVMGSEFVLSGSYSWSGACSAMVVFFLVNNLLLINQFPDIKPDRAAGRKNIPIIWGPEKAIRLTGLFFILAYGCLAGGIAINLLPYTAAAGFISIFPAFITFRKLQRYSDKDIGKLVPFMGLNVANVLLTPALITIGILATIFIF